MQAHYKELIAKEFTDCVENTISRILSKEQRERPFHSALLSKDVIFWSALERSFSTSFGQRVIEEIARLVVLSNGADEAKRQKVTSIIIDNNYERAIQQHILTLRSGHRIDKSWSEVVQEIQRIPLAGSTSEIRIISDLWWKKDNVDNYISLKTVMPNIDQTIIAKEDCLRLAIANPECNVYFGLPYNPYGNNREDYNFTPPMNVFNFTKDPVVLIGQELWDTLGGEGCYNELIEIAKEVGVNTQNKLKELRK